jgi:cytochrome c biogenesis protein CcmG, thiol:disulfide interchange protein DsbE
VKLKAPFLVLGGLLVGVLLGILVLVSQPSAQKGTSRKLPPTVGSPVSDFSLPVLSGGSLNLSTLKGKPVVINFWATWCGPCKQEMPLLQQYAQKYSERFALFGVDFQEEPDVVQTFVDSLGLTFPILLDKTGIAADLYFVRNFPTTFFVDSEGVLRAQHVGQLSEEDLAGYLKTIGIEP